MSAIQEAVNYKETLNCIREVLNSFDKSGAYTINQYKRVLQRIEKLLQEQGI